MGAGSGWHVVKDKALIRAVLRWMRISFGTKCRGGCGFPSIQIALPQDRQIKLAEQYEPLFRKLCCGDILTHVQHTNTRS
jgi:hypothetical protein